MGPDSQFEITSDTPQPNPVSQGAYPVHEGSAPETPTSNDHPMVKTRTLGRLARLEELLRRFSPSERLVLYFFALCLGCATVIALIGLNAAISVEVPAPGGTFAEGEISPARFINPLLAISQADQDLSMLIFSGLTRPTESGEFIADLASSYDISEDGTTYTFHIRDSAQFHDGKPLTSKDVAFTVGLAQNPDYKSVKRADWEGVSVSTPDARTVVFKLPHAYAPFIEDTTLGILPEHVWKDVSPEDFPFVSLNTHPVGSGPYLVLSINADSTGASERYELAPFEHFTLGRPYISRIAINFYANAGELLEAFKNHDVDALAGISPADLSSISREDVSLATVPLPRVFGVFFNQNRNAALSDTAARSALNTAVDKDAIVTEVLGGYGATLDGPIPSSIFEKHRMATVKKLSEIVPAASSSQNVRSNADDSRTILKKGGWSTTSTSSTWTKKKLPPLSLKLATVDTPELVATANIISENWRAAGISSAVQVYPLSEFNNAILRPREYDAVLFGEVVGRAGDTFAFWHSSQRNDPGLNLSLYTNAKADTVLTESRATVDRDERIRLYEEFTEIVHKDQPAIFLYSPDFLYLIPSTLQGAQLGGLTSAPERFLNVYEWHTATERVWSFLADRK